MNNVFEKTARIAGAGLLVISLLSVPGVRSLFAEQPNDEVVRYAKHQVENARRQIEEFQARADKEQQALEEKQKREKEALVNASEQKKKAFEERARKDRENLNAKLSKEETRLRANLQKAEQHTEGAPRG